jgi:hypothetical protein
VGSQRHFLAAITRRRPGTHCIGGWVGPRAILEGCGKFLSQQDSIPDYPACSESLYRLNCPGPHISLLLGLKRLIYWHGSDGGFFSNCTLVPYHCTVHAVTIEKFFIAHQIAHTNRSFCNVQNNHKDVTVPLYF